MAGYSRDQFGHGWIDTDHNGCDTRNDILRRDLSGVVAKAGTHGCVVAGGVLNDHYTGTTITFHRGETTSTAVEIDHLVALADAWRTGAQDMSTAQREQLANDPIELLAVSGPANESKGDQDASQWLPSNNAFDCTYVADQITIKATYGLWITSAEHDAMASTLRDCGGVAPRPRTTTVAPPPPPATTHGPPPDTPQAPPTHSTDNGDGSTDDGGGASVVHPGAFCSPEGAVGITDRGTPMRCTSKNGDQPRWRSAG
ncbi:HNH endonuclease family protein [Actinocatenispora thailandica]|nr:HNH endonuclease family protein [Actinocatenispora thailandica]